MVYVNKRLNFFDRQFLRAKDLKDEQDYHIDRRRMHNELLHTPGVVESLPNSLKVTAVLNSTNRVSVTSGVAINSKGQEIVFNSGQTLNMPAGQPWVDIYVCYKDVNSEPSADPGITGFMRIEESPELRIVPPDIVDTTISVRLARIFLDGNGNFDTTKPVNGQIDTSPAYRGAAGTNLTDTSFNTITIRNPFQISDYPTFSSSQIKEVTLDGKLRATAFIGNLDGSQIVTGTVADARIGTTIARRADLVEKLNGDFVHGVILVTSDPNSKIRTVGVTDKNIQSKLVILRGWITIVTGDAPELPRLPTQKSTLWWTTKSTIQEGWAMNSSSTDETIPGLLTFGVAGGVTVDLKINTSGANDGVFFTINAPAAPVGQNIGYVFQLLWSEL